MRTPDEIVARIKESGSFFGFDADVLVPYLPYEQACEFLTPAGVAKYKATWVARPQDESAVRHDMCSYLPFAQEKAERGKGLSALRSIEKLCAWLWLLGDAEALAFAENKGNYAPHGEPIVSYVSQRYSQSAPASPGVDP